MDYYAGTVCGHMEAMDVPMSVSNVVTFWEGEVTYSRISLWRPCPVCNIFLRKLFFNYLLPFSTILYRLSTLTITHCGQGNGQQRRRLTWIIGGDWRRSGALTKNISSKLRKTDVSRAKSPKSTSLCDGKVKLLWFDYSLGCIGYCNTLCYTIKD